MYIGGIPEPVQIGFQSVVSAFFELLYPLLVYIEPYYSIFFTELYRKR